MDEILLTEIDRLLAVNTALDTKLLAVMMSMHARLATGSVLRVLNESLITTICDMFRRESKASSLLDEGDVEEEEESDSGSGLKRTAEWGIEEEEEVSAAVALVAANE